RTVTDRAETRLRDELRSEVQEAGEVLADVVASNIELARLASHTEGVAESLEARDISSLQTTLGPLVGNFGKDLLVVHGTDGSEVASFWKQGDKVEVSPSGLEASLATSIVATAQKVTTGSPDKAVLVAKAARGPLLLTSTSVRNGESVVGALSVGTLARTLAGRPSQETSAELYTLAGERISGVGERLDLKPEQLRGQDRSLDLQGRAVAVGVLKARGSDVLKIAISQRTQGTFDELRRSAFRVALLGLAAIVAVVALGIALARAITSPLERVASTARGIAGGDLSQRANVRSGDEIGTLGEAFNAMADRLQTSYEELERRVAERTRDLEVANEELARGAQVKSEFLANMSHELRTPLNAILGYSEVLSDPFFGPLKPGESRKQAKAIHQSGLHLLDLINDLLDLAKIEAGKLILHVEDVPVRQTVKEMLNLMQPLAAAKSLRLRSRMPRAPDFIRADEKRFRQILLNLLSNAIKFTPEGGSVTVEAEETDGELVLSVVDTGVGIAPEEQAKIFDQFHQVDGSYSRGQEGTGLGLALTRQLVELHGGTISVVSEIDKGSRFTFTVPRTVRTKKRAKVAS
ncbi:MAG TPA: HAMP domain-containing sensor histidine kinase, partial [Actinomycetota bacterium]|nr:HAMP domain-containing sensor histidine kinase [Actinomycetota bacterium]